MIDGRDLLERAAESIAAPERVMDGLHRRRERKRRNQRVLAAALALIVAGAALGISLTRSQGSTNSFRPTT